ncbi:ROK family transcriptional regulator [Tsukamurella sp. 1534]|uniref:ROK family transcriptional regulator n=1 Tax=Tsukamurella sp. 1534 TaxID=1151061 RepID=UPI0002E1FFDA|nr:ROK family transcriptional regulator [Tsukamurella sp. 1534]
MPEARPGSPSALRNRNRDLVTEALRRHGRLTQAELARETGLAAATVSNIVRALVDIGRLEVDDGPGRRRIVRLAEDAGYVVGVDYGFRHINVGVSAQNRDLLCELRAPVDPRISAPGGLAVVRRLVRDALDRAGVRRDEIVGAGLGLPVPVERATSRVGLHGILPPWIGVDAAALATDVLDLPVEVAVDNDANLGALAERRWGAGIGAQSLVYLKMSEGVGAGLILDGRPFAGTSGTAGEIGHVAADEAGEACRCGKRGCLETVASARAVTTALRPLLGASPTVAKAVDLARLGDRDCQDALERVGHYAGFALADLCNVLNPELIVIGGELAQAARIILPAMRQAIDRRAVPTAAQAVRIRASKLGPRAHLLGAIALAIGGSGAAPVFTS